VKGFHTTFEFQRFITDLNDDEIKEVQAIDSYIRALARIVEIRQSKIERRKQSPFVATGTSPNNILRFHDG